MWNKRGFIETGVVIIIAVCAALVAWFGPSLIKSVGTLTSGGDKNQQKAIHKQSGTRPVVIADANGNVYSAGVEKYEIYSNDSTAQEPPETLWEKFWHLGAMAVVIIVVLSYLGITPIIRLWWNAKVKPQIDTLHAQLESEKLAKEDLAYDTKKIVLSMEKALAKVDPAQKQAMLDEMSKVQDSSTKTLVATLKQTI